MGRDPNFAGVLFNLLYDAVIFAAPPLIVGTIVAFLIGLFQAVTQIQEQTLPQTVKIVVIVMVLMFYGGMLALPLFHHATELFDTFGSTIR